MPSVMVVVMSGREYEDRFTRVSGAFIGTFATTPVSSSPERNFHSPSMPFVYPRRVYIPSPVYADGGYKGGDELSLGGTGIHVVMHMGDTVCTWTIETVSIHDDCGPSIVSTPDVSTTIITIELDRRRCTEWTWAHLEHDYHAKLIVPCCQFSWNRISTWSPDGSDRRTLRASSVFASGSI